jgi:UDP-N-acetylglucosamine 2-epimerase (non-hydrolysing)
VELVLKENDLDHRSFALVTLHRPENVDDPERLRQLLVELGRLPIPVVFPMHPRTRATAERADLAHLLDPLRVTLPIGYREFLSLLGACAITISDSGGIQEEVSVLKVPLVVVRRSTERPEVLDTFATLTDDPNEMYAISSQILARGESLFAELAQIPSPYGDGNASHKMYQSLQEFVSG